MPDWMEPYYFHEQGFDSLEEIEEWFEWRVPDQFNIAEYICDRWAEERPDGVALYVDDGEAGQTAYTFADLRRRADRFANYLADQGVGAGDRIAISGTQRFETLVAHVAAFKLGAVTVPLSVLLGTDGLEYRLSDSEAGAFVVDRGAMETFEAIRDDLDSLDLVVTYGGEESTGRPGDDRFEEAVEDQSAEFETATTDAEDTAFIIYTSGTTGQPKGVVHVHRGLLGQLTQFVSLQVHRTGPEQVARTVAGWSWIMSLPGMLFPALFYGVPFVGSPGDQGFEPEREFQLIEDFGITHLNLPPTAVRMMMQIDRPKERYDLGSLQSLTTGGESADEALINWVHQVFEDADYIEGYGTTETGGLICDDPAVGLDHRMGSFGVASVGHDIEVLDQETLEPKEPNEIGTLAVRYEEDPMLFVEYLGLPEKTAETIREGWLISDDLVSKDEDGYFTYHSRSDDVIISSGYRLSPIEIEEALLTHESVQNAGVIGVPHETRGEIPKAFVVLDAEFAARDDWKDVLQAHVKERLAKYEYPRELEAVEELPLTTTGKVRRQSLREREGIVEE
ncbi:MAG: acyl-CoA synthetase [Halobacteriales archaeon]